MPNTTFSECILSHIFLQTIREQASDKNKSLKTIGLQGERQRVIS